MAALSPNPRPVVLPLDINGSPPQTPAIDLRSALAWYTIAPPPLKYSFHHCAVWIWTQTGPNVLHGGARWCHMANATELSMCGGDADFLSNYFDHLFK